MGLPVAAMAAPAHRAAPRAGARGAPEFFSPLPLAAVALFALNNALLKHAWPGLVTGKLSDLMVCFFLPLFVSALLARVSPLRVGTRVAAGIALTATIFIAVKTSPIASQVLDRQIGLVLEPLGIRTARNRVDVTDLWALPMLAAAWFHARRKAGR